MNSLNKAPKISMVTTCKNRLPYLKESLKTWMDLEYNNYEVVVVDYDCPQGTKDYLDKNRNNYLALGKCLDLRVKKVNNKPFFNLNHARNIAIDHARGDIIFMIDSDIHIRDRKLLLNIDRDFSKNVVFCSNHQILSSRYNEVQSFYKLEFKVEFTDHCLVPSGILASDLSGTACFLKQGYLDCGKFLPKINEKGFGWDEYEYYLRYLNFYFYKKYLKNSIKGKPTPGCMDQVLDRFSVFGQQAFNNLGNPEEEKDRFYPVSLNDTRENNKVFIRDFFNHYLPDLGSPAVFPDKTSSVSLLKYNRVKKVNITSWYPSWYNNWLGSKHFKLKNYAQSKLAFQAVTKNKNSPLRYQCNALFNLGIINKLLCIRSWKYYLRKSLSVFHKIVHKSDHDLYNQAVIHFEIGDLLQAKSIFTTILKSESLLPELRSGAYLFLGDICHKTGQGDWIGYYRQGLNLIKKKTHLSNADKYRLASLYKRIGDNSRAKKWFSDLLKDKINLQFLAGSHFHLGEIHYQEKNIKKSISSFNSCLKIDKHHIKARKYITMLNAELKSGG